MINEKIRTVVCLMNLYWTCLTQLEEFGAMLVSVVRDHKKIGVFDNSRTVAATDFQRSV